MDGNRYNFTTVLCLSTWKIKIVSVGHIKNTTDVVLDRARYPSAHLGEIVCLTAHGQRNGLRLIFLAAIVVSEFTQTIIYRGMIFRLSSCAQEITGGSRLQMK